MLNIVTLSLDGDDKLIPKSCRGPSTATRTSTIEPVEDRITFEESNGDHTTPVVGEFSSALFADGPSILTGTGSTSPTTIRKEDGTASPESDADDDIESNKDLDDFTIMTETQAKRISALCELTFDVQLSTDVVVADANVAALARRILGARSLTRRGEGNGENGGVGGGGTREREGGRKGSTTVK